MTMKIVGSPDEMQRIAEAARRNAERIALVPTMGYLHQGHIALMREGRRRADLLAVSIFVNPTQFGPGEDFARYPRDFERDCGMMRAVPVDIVFAPEASSVYPPGSQTWVEVTELTKGLCGRSRPGHFRGVTTVVAKLFNIVKPHVALFGEKDFQQLRAIQRMVRDLNFDIEIVSVPIVREADGLAMSSRNAYLSAAEREQALALSRALEATRERFVVGVIAPGELVRAATEVLERAGAGVEYVEVVDAETLEPATTLDAPVLIAIAARIGCTRLIDNMVLTPGP
jgi:pantoate--beta-alanine ligase